MKVMVSGSLRGVPDERKKDVRAAARELGKCIGAAGHTVLVGTADADDVDPYVVEGFCDRKNGASGSPPHERRFDALCEGVQREAQVAPLR